ncbi:beta-1,4-galactosyltransferase 7-like [Saccoglossus kowalevskii]|uniref:Beta-1,4-galactosyltransferase n=1 Tax=Saccoglossus kowalevskii TaxID=10224 RepID=A0ABM0M625_SACKO|nr:PREDICTED: beta-1,4-galactosyltransferase 7-like [Saccoglossus kowalevskii]
MWTGKELMARLSITRTLLFMVAVSFLTTVYIMVSYNNCECAFPSYKLPAPGTYRRDDHEDNPLPNIVKPGDEIPIDNNNNNNHDDIGHDRNYREDDHDDDEDGGDDGDDMEYKTKHKLGIIVPFRDRLEELLEFVPYMHEFLAQQNVQYHIYVIHQVDSHRFNRASLLNVGFLHSKLDCDYLVMHDVDLLPVNPDLHYKYSMVEIGPHHISSPELHPKYHYKTFVGGILMMKNEHFELTNGLSNKYWGWGREDDEFYVRMREANLQITYPQDIDTGYESFRHIHSSKRDRDKKRYFNQKEESRRRDRITGLDTVRYELVSKHEMHIDGAPITMINVILDCDKTVTPWCDVPEQV